LKLKASYQASPFVRLLDATERFCQKVRAHRQLPDLGMELFDLSFVIFPLSLAATKDILSRREY